MSLLNRIRNLTNLCRQEVQCDESSKSEDRVCADKAQDF